VIGRGANNSSPLKKKLVRKCYPEPRAGSFEYGNELWGSRKGREFLHELNDCWLLKKDCSMKLVS
jgi:hypothetical protein